jgi:hypothetical protein
VSMPAFKESSATPSFTGCYTRIIGGTWCGDSSMQSSTSMQTAWSRSIAFFTRRAIRRSGAFAFPEHPQGVRP